MAGGVDEVEAINLAAFGLVAHGDRVRLDGDAALALEVHRVEVLFGHDAVTDGGGGLEQAVGERGLAVVNVRDDAEIADMGLVRHGTVIVAEPRAKGSGVFDRLNHFWLLIKRRIWS